MKVGIYFGCFIPLHKGHWSIIQKAKKENDHIILGVCGYKNDRGEKFISFCDRIKLIKELFKDDKNTTISVVDDHKIGLTGTFSLEAWKIWSNELFNNSGFNPYDTRHQYTWYSGESSYIEKIKTIFPEHKFSLVERNEIPISGTAIRNNPKKYKEGIHPLFAKYLSEGDRYIC